MITKYIYFISSFIEEGLNYPISPKLFVFIIHQCQSDSKNDIFKSIDNILFKALKIYNFNLADYIIKKISKFFCIIMFLLHTILIIF